MPIAMLDGQDELMVQAEYMAKFEQYRKARADGKPASALHAKGTESSGKTTMTAGAARVKAAVRQPAVSMKPERTPLRKTAFQQ